MGAKYGLFFPRKITAAREAARPRDMPFKSITIFSLVFAACIFLFNEFQDGHFGLIVIPAPGPGDSCVTSAAIFKRGGHFKDF